MVSLILQIPWLIKKSLKLISSLEVFCEKVISILWQSLQWTFLPKLILLLPTLSRSLSLFALYFWTHILSLQSLFLSLSFFLSYSLSFYLSLFVFLFLYLPLSHSHSPFRLLIWLFYPVFLTYTQCYSQYIPSILPFSFKFKQQRLQLQLRRRPTTFGWNFYNVLFQLHLQLLFSFKLIPNFKSPKP